MRCHRNIQQDIATGTAIAAFATLALQPDLLSVAQACRNANVHLPPVRHVNTAGAATGCFLETHSGSDFIALAGARPLPAATPSATQSTAEQFGKNVLGTKALGCISVRTPVVLISARAAAFEPMRAWIEAAGIATRIDLATVESRALFLVAKDIVSAADLLEFLLCGRISAFGVGVILLGQRAERLLDLGFARGLGNPENLIWIAHAISCRRKHGAATLEYGDSSRPVKALAAKRRQT